jgi:hypothetical protein
MTGFFAASQYVFSHPPPDLSDQNFLSLVAIVIAPGPFRLNAAE